VIEKTKDFPLSFCPYQLVPVDERLLVHHFHGEKSLCPPEFHKVNTANISIAKALQKPEVDWAERWVPASGQLDGLPPAIAPSMPLDMAGTGAIQAVTPRSVKAASTNSLVTFS